MNENELKQQLLSICYSFVNEKIETYKVAMDAAQDAANSESKSSAGDKYETTRALMQIERDNHAKQLSETLKLKQALDQIKPHIIHDKADFGSIIITNKQQYFLAISIGMINFDGKQYIGLSPSSPLGRQLMGLKKDDKLTFNNTESKIVNIL